MRERLVHFFRQLSMTVVLFCTGPRGYAPRWSIFLFTEGYFSGVTPLPLGYAPMEHMLFSLLEGGCFWNDHGKLL